MPFMDAMVRLTTGQEFVASEREEGKELAAWASPGWRVGGPSEQEEEEGEGSRARGGPSADCYMTDETRIVREEVAVCSLSSRALYPGRFHSPFHVCASGRISDRLSLQKHTDMDAIRRPRPDTRSESAPAIPCSLPCPPLP